MAKRSIESKKRIKAVVRELFKELWPDEPKSVMESEVRFLSENLDTTPWFKEMVLERL